jgi:uncharacterized DUF497 family protein
VQKNESKHGVSRLEAESAFYDPHYRLFEDQRHSSRNETRYILYGRSLEARVLMVGFTRRGRKRGRKRGRRRGRKIRIITARPASRKERRMYGAET